MEKEYEDILTIDNVDYVIVDEMFYEGEKYIYVIALEDENKVSILKETEEDGEDYVESIPEDRVELFMSLFAKRFIKATKKN